MPNDIPDTMQEAYEEVGRQWSDGDLGGWPEPPPTRSHRRRRPVPVIPTVTPNPRAQHHNGRPTEVISGRIPLSDEELAEGIELTDEATWRRPKTRNECADGHRPCPFVGCRYHLFLDVTGSGSVKLNFPSLSPEDLPQSCALDVADQHPLTLDMVGAVMNLTRERVRQIEAIGFRELQTEIERRGLSLDELLPTTPADPMEPHR